MRWEEGGQVGQFESSSPVAMVNYKPQTPNTHPTTPMGSQIYMDHLPSFATDNHYNHIDFKPISHHAFSLLALAFYPNVNKTQMQLK